MIQEKKLFFRISWNHRKTDSFSNHRSLLQPASTFFKLLFASLRASLPPPFASLRVPSLPCLRFPSLRFPSLPFASLPFASLSFASLDEFASLPFPSLPFASLRFPSFPFASLRFPSLPCPSLPFPSLPFVWLPFPWLPFPSLPFPCFPLLRFASLHFVVVHLALHFASLRLASLRLLFSSNDLFTFTDQPTDGMQQTILSGRSTNGNCPTRPARAKQLILNANSHQQFFASSVSLKVRFALARGRRATAAGVIILKCRGGSRGGYPGIQQLRSGGQSES